MAQFVANFSIQEGDGGKLELPQRLWKQCPVLP
jgi:hypothetical protein